MNKRIILLNAFIALGLLSIPNNKTNTIAEEKQTTLKPVDIYQENFDEYELNASGLDIYNEHQFMWFEDSHVDSKVINYNDSKALEYMVISSDSNGYTKFGGLGTSATNNLEKLVDGETYTLSMDITIETTSENSALFIEYQTFTWTGVKIVGGTKMEILSTENTSNANYTQTKLSFTFVAGKINNSNSYITFTGKDFEITDKVYVDNILISQPVLAYDYEMNFENLSIGTSAPMNNLSSIPNVYNAEINSLIISGDENNHYLHASSTGTSNEQWKKFYFNNLTKLISGNKYRISMDVLEANCLEFYLCYNESGQPCATYNPSGYVGKDESEYIIGGAFDGEHLTFDFIPNINKDATWWQQLAVVVKFTDEMSIKLDNITLYNLDKAGESLVIDSSNVKTSYYVGENIDLSNLKVDLKRLNDTTRTLMSTEYLLDTSDFDNTKTGDYDINVVVIDEYGNELKNSFIVHVKNDVVISCKLNKLPNKLNYLLNEPIDLNGIQIEEKYESGKKNIINSLESIKIKKYDASKVGNQKVVISYLDTFELEFEITIYPSVIDSFKNVQTKARLSFDYLITANEQNENLRYSDFKNVSIDTFYDFDISKFIDVEEIGVFIITSNYEFADTNKLPENGQKIINENNSKEFTYKLNNITNYKQIYYISAYIKTIDGTYHFAKSIAYSVETMLENYIQDVDSNYYAIANSFYETIRGVKK